MLEPYNFDFSSKSTNNNFSSENLITFNKSNTIGNINTAGNKPLLISEDHYLKNSYNSNYSSSSYDHDYTKDNNNDSYKGNSNNFNNNYSNNNSNNNYNNNHSENKYTSISSNYGNDSRFASISSQPIENFKEGETSHSKGEGFIQLLGTVFNTTKDIAGAIKEKATEYELGTKIQETGVKTFEALKVTGSYVYEKGTEVAVIYKIKNSKAIQ
jgi:hypothetical protein